MKKRKSSGFSKALIIYTAVLAVIAAAAVAVLWTALAGYQTRVDAETLEKAHAQEAYRAPQTAAQDYVSSLTAEDWTDIWFKTRPGTLDSRETVISCMTGLFMSGDTLLYKDTGYSDEKPVYILKNGDMELARISVGGSDVFWYPVSLELLLTADRTASVTVPEGAAVRCNGVLLGTEYAVPCSENFGAGKYAVPENEVRFLTYTVTEQLSGPELTVESTDPGRALSVYREGVYVSCLPDGETKEYYQEKAYDFMRAYLYYCMMGESNPWGNMANAQNYTVYNSPAYNAIGDSYIGILWNTSFPDAVYEIDTAGEVLVWAENIMSIDVPFYTKGERYGYSMINEGTCRIWFVNSGNGFGIYAFDLN